MASDPRGAWGTEQVHAGGALRGCVQAGQVLAVGCRVGLLPVAALGESALVVCMRREERWSEETEGLDSPWKRLWMGDPGEGEAPPPLSSRPLRR